MNKLTVNGFSVSSFVYLQKETEYLNSITSAYILMKISDNRNYVNQIQIDCVIFGYEKRELKILVAKIKHIGDFYTLPSGYILEEEDIDEAAKRTLQERTGIADIYLEEFKVFGKANKGRKEFINELIRLNYQDIAEEQLNSSIYKWFTNRFISVGYYSLVNLQEVHPRPTAVDESISWYNIHEVPKMIMDYDEIFAEALKALREDIDSKFNAFNLLPEKFTIMEVQEIYETILEKEFIRTNFQKKILDLNVLERLEKKFTGAKNKAPYLYRLKK